MPGALLEPAGDGTYTYATTCCLRVTTSSRLPSVGLTTRITGRMAPLAVPTTSFATKANKLVTFTYDSATHKVDIASADARSPVLASSAPTG